MIVQKISCSEKEYRDLDCLSYSVFSNIEEQGALNYLLSERVDNSGVRGFALGGLVDRTISERKEKPCMDGIKVINKVPAFGESTHRVVMDLVKHEIERGNPNGHDVDAMIVNTEIFADGITIFSKMMNLNNYVAKLTNYREFIKEQFLAMKKGEDIICIGISDQKIMKASIDRFRTFPELRHDFVNNDQRGVYYQVKLVSEVMGIKIKAMLDVILVDHVNKTIRPVDMKTGMMDKNDYDTFIDKSYIRYKYYIQSGLYKKMLVEYCKTHAKFKDYKVLDFMFLYSTTSFKSGLSEKEPFKYIINDKQYIESFKGFEHLGSHRKGIIELIEEYKKAVEIKSRHSIPECIALANVELAHRKQEKQERERAAKAAVTQSQDPF